MLATWHAIAKLRMHSTSTVTVLEGVTKTLGQLLRRFNDHVCSKYSTHKTPSELQKRARRKASEAAKKKSQQPATANLNADSEKPEKVASTNHDFNLAAYKPHALGHYPLWIRLFGTTDSYSTQTVLSFLHLISISSYHLY